jgi:hypothetical protein
VEIKVAGAYLHFTPVTLFLERLTDGEKLIVGEITETVLACGTTIGRIRAGTLVKRLPIEERSVVGRAAVCRT